MGKATGMMFPGQGSQTVGMLANLAAEHGAIGTTFAEASAALGDDLWALVQGGPAEDLDRTENTQPALLTASVALWRAWLAASGPMPAVAAGHSLGEYSALVAAEAMSLADAVVLVRERGRLMQDAVPAGKGAMAAILGLDAEQVEQCCRQAAEDGVVAPANYNAPGQVVIAGDAAAVERAIVACKGAGAKRAMALSVSVPSHCQLMTPAAERFAAQLESVAIGEPKFPIIQNLDAQASTDADGIRRRLLAQLHSPVRWTESVAAMGAQGVGLLVECGPGKVLCGLVKRINREIEAVGLGDAAGFAAALEKAREVSA
ncbi:MAG: ACP S-malonyltransferase [Gammaproteobacteria bacterium]|nr:ACP S-malonyltransferase [Gammaproteobacteria bacterium]